MPRDPESRRLAGRIGGLQLHATHDSREVTEPARAGFKRKFLDMTDPRLPLPERLKRADMLLRLHMTRMALKSLQVRQRNAAKRQPGKHLDSSEEEK